MSVQLRSRSGRARLFGSVSALAIVVTGLVVGPSNSVLQAAVGVGDVGTVVPARLLDTRAAGETVDGDSEGGGKVAAGEFIKVQIAGRGNVPADAVGVELNITSIQNEGGGFASLYPCTATPPTASTLNFTPGVNIANATTVALNSSGEVCVFTSSTSHYALDVVAYIPAGSDVGTVVPARLLDTRAAGETVDGDSEGGGKVAAGEFIKVQIAGRGNVPADAVGVELNITSIQNEGGGFASLYPCTATPPTASTLNFTPGVNIANATTVALNSDGEVCVFTSSTSHYALDVVAHVSQGTTRPPTPEDPPEGSLLGDLELPDSPPLSIAEGAQRLNDAAEFAVIRDDKMRTNGGLPTGFDFGPSDGLDVPHGSHNLLEAARILDRAGEDNFGADEFVHLSGGPGDGNAALTFRHGSDMTQIAGSGSIAFDAEGYDLAVGDIDADGLDETAVSLRNGEIIIIDDFEGFYQELARIEIAFGSPRNAVTMADLDRDGDDELIVGILSGQGGPAGVPLVRTYDWTSESGLSVLNEGVLPNTDAIAAPGQVITNPAVAAGNFDDDDDIEIVFGATVRSSPSDYPKFNVYDLDAASNRLTVGRALNAQENIVGDNQECFQSFANRCDRDFWRDLPTTFEVGDLNRDGQDELAWSWAGNEGIFEVFPCQNVAANARPLCEFYAAARGYQLPGTYTDIDESELAFWPGTPRTNVTAGVEPFRSPNEAFPSVVTPTEYQIVDLDYDGYKDLLIARSRCEPARNVCTNVQYHGYTYDTDAGWQSLFDDGFYREDEFETPLGLALAAGDFDGDALTVRPVRVTESWSDPQVISVMAAPPIDATLTSQNQDNSFTAYGIDTEVDTDVITDGTITTNYSTLTFNASFTYGITIFEGGFNRYSLHETTLIESSGSSLARSSTFYRDYPGDGVVFAATPYRRVHYEVLTSRSNDHPAGEEMTLNLVNGPPQVTSVSLSYFNDNVGDESQRIPDDVFQHTPGKIDTYPTTGERNRLRNDGCNFFESDVRTVNQGAGTEEGGITIGESDSSSNTTVRGSELTFGVGGGGLRVDVGSGEFNTWGWESTTSAGVRHGFSVGNIADPDEYTSNRYQFGMMVYDYSVDSSGAPDCGRTAARAFNVINYWVK